MNDIVSTVSLAAHTTVVNLICRFRYYVHSGRLDSNDTPHPTALLFLHGVAGLFAYTFFVANLAVLGEWAVGTKLSFFCYDNAVIEDVRAYSAYKKGGECRQGWRA